MRTHHDAKLMAKSLRTALAERGSDLTHAQALEIVARQFGLDDWNVLAARIGEGPRFTQTCPILRIFDEEKAREFYLGFLGFRLDFEHRFAPGMPLYAGVERGGLILHLSAHHGDATPGATVFARMAGIRAFREELIGRNYANMRPGIEEAPWGLEMTVTDPFGNRIRFCESS